MYSRWYESPGTPIRVAGAAPIGCRQAFPQTSGYENRAIVRTCMLRDSVFENGVFRNLDHVPDFQPVPGMKRQAIQCHTEKATCTCRQNDV
jgi:hypothetical protein